MNKEFNEEFMKLSEKDQKSILNLIQLKNMNKATELNELKEFKKEIVETVEQVSRNEYFYKYNNKYLRSEIINELQRIIDKYEC